MKITSGSLALLLALGLVATACGDDADSSSGATEVVDPTTSPTTEAPTTTTELPALVGTWRTEPITAAAVDAALRASGLDEWIDDFAAQNFGQSEPSFLLEIGEEWDMYLEDADGVRTPVDYDAEYDIEGDEVTFHHSEGDYTYRWTVEGDTLTLEFVDTTAGSVGGIPEEVYQRALYETATFTRVA